MLVKEGKHREEELRQQEQMHLKRHQALLATVEALEERIDTLATQLAEARCLRSKHNSSDIDSDLAEPNTAGDDCLPPRLTSSSSDETRLQVVATLRDSTQAPTKTPTSLVAEPQHDQPEDIPDPDVPFSACTSLTGVATAPASERLPDATSPAGMASNLDDGRLPSVPTPYADQVRRDGPSTVVDASTADGFTRVVRRKRSRGTGGRVPVSSQQASRSASTGLRGAERVRCKAFHLARVSLESTPQDVIAFCRKARVTVTGCYILRSRVWGTQSFKVYIDEACEQQVLGETFWPAHLRCRLWEREPPRSNVERGKDDAPSSRSSRPASPSA